MGKTAWARVVQLFSEVFSLEVVGIDVDTVNGNEPRYLEIQDIADRINAALDAHPEIVRWKAIEKAAEKMAEALEQLNMECRMADNRGELAGEVDGGTMDNAESALKAYEKSKSQDKGE